MRPVVEHRVTGIEIGDPPEPADGERRPEVRIGVVRPLNVAWTISCQSVIDVPSSGPLSVPQELRNRLLSPQVVPGAGLEPA